MIKQAAISAAVLLVLGCKAQADDQVRYRAIDEAINVAMCASADGDRELGLVMLAKAVDSYQGKDEDDNGASAAEASLEAFDHSKCEPRKSAGSDVRP